MEWTEGVFWCAGTDSTSLILFARLISPFLRSAGLGSDSAEERSNCSFSSECALHFATEMIAMCAFACRFSSFRSAESCCLVTLAALA